MYRRHRRSKITILLTTLLCIAAIIIGIFSYQYFMTKVRKSVTLEAGTQLSDAREFLINKDEDASFETDLSTLDLNTPGAYPLQIRTGGKIYTVTLNIVDTTAPAADVVNQAAPVGDELKPEAFLNNIKDATSVTVSYKTPPDFGKTGEQPVTLVLTDTSSNRAELPASLTLIDIKKTVRIEAGSPLVDVKEFQNTTAYKLSYETDMSKLNLNKPAVHDIKIKADNSIITCKLEVIDSTPPAATAVDQEAWVGDTLDAGNFVRNIVDVSPVAVSFKNNPDTKKAGTFDTVIQLKDDSGNITELTAVLTIKADTQAPVIAGAVDRTVYIGDKVSYKTNITVSDNRDKEVDFTVDNSQVNLRKAGTYSVIYSAKDSSGNKTEKTITLTVKEYQVDKSALDSLAEDILDNITNSSMSQRDKAYAIYKWTKSHISYTGYSDKSDWMKEAYNGIKKGVGDCFTYFAVSKELLTLAGIENMDITRVGGTTRHYWSLTKTGDGWYHYDSCPNVDHKESFMLTDSQLEALSQKRGNNYYNYNKSLYPATPKE